ncbi:MAG: carboxymuconolactone decarboxylase family protein [Polyangiaceae bacterium]
MMIARIIGRAAGTGPPNVFTTLARHRSLFWRWLVFAGGLMPGGRLPRAETELIILRVAHLCECPYEWDHHARLGRKAGLTPQDIDGARTAGIGADMGIEVRGAPRRLAILRAVDEMHADRRIGDATWATLASYLDERELIELCMLVGHYEMIAMTLNSLGVQIDARDGAHRIRR